MTFLKSLNNYLKCVYMQIIKTNTIYEYALRIDELHDGGDKIKLLGLFTNCETPNLIISQEISKEVKKTHYHVFVKIAMKIKELRNKIDYLFKEHKKGSKSLAICKKPESYLSYIIKDAQIIHKIGYTDADLLAVKKWEAKPEFKQNMVQLLHAHVGLKKPLEDITDSILQWYDINNKPFDKFRIKGYAYALYYKNNNKNVDVKRDIRSYILS